LGKLAYHIEKGHIDTDKLITMKSLIDAGVCSKITNGVKLLGKGAENFSALNIPINLEISDASALALDAVQSLGGSVKVVYRTDLLLRNHLKPHKFHADTNLKTPMPPPKKVKKMESLKRKGLEVEYPDAPWYTDNVEKIAQDYLYRKERIKSGQNSEYLEHLPAKRLPTPDKVKIEKEAVFKRF
jgi:hypothetical protein